MAPVGPALEQLGRMMPGGMADPAQAADSLRLLIHLVAPGAPALGPSHRPHDHGCDYTHLRPVLESFLAGLFGCAPSRAWEEAAAWVDETGVALRHLTPPDPHLRLLPGGKLGPTRA